MICDPLKKYIGKPPAWYFAKALAALAGTDSSFCVKFTKAVSIGDNSIRATGIRAVLCSRCNHFALPLWKFDLEESAALRAQAIYWGPVRHIGG